MAILINIYFILSSFFLGTNSLFVVPDFCYQPKDLGHCRGNIQRYYYNPKERRCEIFNYSGCGGNRNNFMSLPECQEKCLSMYLSSSLQIYLFW